MIFLSMLLASGLAAAETALPSYVSLAPTIHDYIRFADGGPDANWYVGFNNAWIVKLPAAPEGKYQHAFIGAKLGRAKTNLDLEKPLIRHIIPGQVYIGISPAPFWSAERGFFLADTTDIPAEPDAQTRVDGIGAAEWFWAEVPLSLINFTGPNYLIIWSPTSELTGAASAPILAAADDSTPSNELNAWNNRSLQGVPPRTPAGALETPIHRILPALTIKLVSGGAPPTVADFSAARGGSGLLVQFAVSGTDVSEGWVESSRNGIDWSRASRDQRRPPYIFDLPAGRAAPGAWLRGAARDVAGNIAYSESLRLPYEQSQQQ